MNTRISLPEGGTRSTARLAAGLTLAALLGCLDFAPTAQAGVPEPDTILYGTLELDGMPVTAAESEVVVEARRLIDGPALASYRMGSAPAAGDLYSLRLRMESTAPTLDPQASVVGDALFIVVTDATGFRGQVVHALGDRGSVERRDLSFGAGVADADEDGLPDAWEDAHLGGLGAGPGTVMANGQTAAQNYIAGTNPNDPSSLFEVQVDVAEGQFRVSFMARKAEGTGYAGRSRFYSLESAADFAEGWEGVPGFARVLGDNQRIEWSGSTTNPPSFFRGRVWLE